jgi:hypothetical protein
MDVRSYIHLRTGEPPPHLKDDRPFKAVLVIEDTASREWRTLVCDWLVRSGCRYALAWGQECEIWHDSVDRANLTRFDFAEIPDDEFVMTTWHDDEPLSEAFWFSQFCTSHPTFDLDRTIIVHISTTAREAELLSEYDAAPNAQD